MDGLTGAGTTRLARRRDPPGLALSACRACVRRYAHDRTKRYRTQDRQCPRTYVCQGNLAPEEGSRAGAAATANQQR